MRDSLKIGESLVVNERTYGSCGESSRRDE